MEAKIKQCTDAGSKGKISYRVRTGHVVREIVMYAKRLIMI
jgi:hypothetical protein